MAYSNRFIVDTSSPGRGKVPGVEVLYVFWVFRGIVTVIAVSRYSVGNSGPAKRVCPTDQLIP